MHVRQEDICECAEITDISVYGLNSTMKRSPKVLRDGLLHREQYCPTRSALFAICGRIGTGRLANQLSYLQGKSAFGNVNLTGVLLLCSRWLCTSGQTYGRPIGGQMEICGLSYSDSSCYWKTAEGIFIKPSGDVLASVSSHIHSEL